MKNNSIKWWILAVAIAAQFAVIIYSAIFSQRIIDNGLVLKFRLEGYDPHDFFRGDYLRINFQNDTIFYPNRHESGTLYVGFIAGNDSIAIPNTLYDAPQENSLKANVEYNNEEELSTVSYPFDRIWMNQEQCSKADTLINNALSRGEDAFALVAIKKGEGRIIGIEVNGKRIL